MSQTSEVGENLTAMALNVVKTIFLKKFKNKPESCII